MFVVRLLAHRGRARPVRFPALQSCSHEEHIKCSSARAELAINLTGRARPPMGEQAAETRSVQSNIVRTKFWPIICSPGWSGWCGCLYPPV